MPHLTKQTFAASYDLTAKIISACVVVLLLVIVIATGNALIGVLELCILALLYLFSPQSYEVSDGTILIKRLIGTVRLPLDSVREIRTGSADDFYGCNRLWASGGLFGYFGLCRTKKLGKCKWYMTNRGNSVIVEGSGMTAVISPNEISDFLAAVRSEAPEATAVQTSESMEAPKAKAGANVGEWIGGVVGVLVVGFVGLALLYSPGAPEITLTSTSLIIHDRFYPITLNAADIDVSGMKIVNIKADHEWTPIAKTNGFANAHYHSGWFQVAKGPVRMYWANGENLVLLPSRHNGPPVLAQVQDPEQFIQRVRQEWAKN